MQSVLNTVYFVLRTPCSLHALLFSAAKNRQKTSAAGRFLAPRRGGVAELPSPCCLRVYGGRPPPEGEIGRSKMQTHVKTPKPLPGKELRRWKDHKSQDMLTRDNLCGIMGGKDPFLGARKSGEWKVQSTQYAVATYDAVPTQYCVLCTAYSLLPALHRRTNHPAAGIPEPILSPPSALAQGPEVRALSRYWSAKTSQTGENAGKSGQTEATDEKNKVENRDKP